MKPSIAILFVPDRLTDASRFQTEALYARLSGLEYDTVVFAERSPIDSGRKIPMPSVGEFTVGEVSVPANDALRNDFCDEDDDFYVDDVALRPDMSVFEHLPLLRNALTGDFSMVSVPLCDSDPAIVREFAYVISEIMGGRNGLLVVACHLDAADTEGWARLAPHLDTMNHSNLFNIVNNGTVDIRGAEVFIGGLLVADAWGLTTRFEGASRPGESRISGSASVDA